MNLHHNLKRNNKGIGTVFGMVFFLLIVMVVFASFVIILNQNTGLEQTTIQAKQLDLDRYTELQTVSITNPEIAVLNSRVYISCSITNNGTLPAELARLWIKDVTQDTVGNTIMNPSIILQPGHHIQYFNSSYVVNASSFDQFGFWFMTTRGNAISAYPNTNQFSGINATETFPGVTDINSTYSTDVTPLQLSLVTTKPNQLIYVVVSYDDENTLYTPTSIPSLTWTRRSQSLDTDYGIMDGDSTLETYYAIKPSTGPLQISVHSTADELSDYYCSALAFAISDVNTTSPFDGAAQTSVGKSIMPLDTITTHYSNELIIGALSIDSLNPAITPGAGFAEIMPVQSSYGATGEPDAQPRSVWSEWDITNAPRTNLSVNCTFTSTKNWAIIVDAVRLVVIPPVSPVSLSPISGPIGQPVTVSGQGFAANSPLIATFDDSQVPFSFTTDSSGKIPPNAIFTVPQGSTEGNKIVKIIDSKFNYATTNFTVTTSSITVSPQIGPVGTAVTITGSNFIDNSTIAINFNGNSIVTNPSAIKADAAGSFSATFNASGTAGIKQVWTSDGVNSLYANFTITPSIALTPKNGLNGTPVTISGQGFAPISSVTITFGGAPVSTSPPNIMTDTTGSFSDATFSASSPTIGAKIVNATDASGNSGSDNFNLVTLSRFTITGYPSSVIAGTSFGSVSVTAYDSNNNVINGYLGQVYFTSTDNNAVLPYTSPSRYTFTLEDNGSHIFSGFTLQTAGSKTFTVTDGTISQISNVIAVNPSALDHFAISGTPISVTAGTSFGNVVVAAYDVYGNVKTDYTGQVYFTSTDGAAVLPYTSGSRYTFVSGDQGDHIFAGFTLKTVGSRTITVTDGTRSAVSSGITVNPNVLNRFTIAGYPSSVAAGTSFGGVVITTYDTYGNVKTDYTGQVYFTSTDAQAVLPFISGSRYTFTSGSGLDNGVHSFDGFTLKTVGSRTITVTDGSTSQPSGAITVNVVSVDHFAVTGFADPVVAGTAGSVTVTAKDPYENTVTSYVGTVHITSSDGSAVLPADHALASGVYTFTNGVTLRTTGDQSITATDTATGLITGSQTAITVNPAAIASFTIAGYPSSTAAGTSFGGVVVTAYDTYGNVKTDYTGQVYFTSTDGAAVLPYTSGSRYTFVSGDQGDHIFAGFTLKTVGSRTITVTDGTRSATSAGITVVSGAIDHFTFAGVPASVTAGSGFAGSVTVTAYDSSNNVKTDYLGSVYFTSSDAQAVLAFNSGNMYTFVSGDNGVHAFAGSGFVLKTVPSQTITVRDDAASKFLTSSAITVNFAPLDHFTFSTISSPKVAGTGFSITITAKDAFENTVTSYTTAGTLSDLSGTISPTASGAFVSGVRTVTVTITKTYSDDTISITASTKSGTSNAFTVNPGAIHHFTLAGVPASVTAGQVFGSVTVTAYDSNNNVKTDYVGSVYFTSTDVAAVLPFISGSRYTFTSGSGLDNGVHSFDGFTLKTVGSRTITVTDGAVSLTSGAIAVGFAPVDHFAVTGFADPVVAGTAGSVTVTAKDPYENTVTSYVGTVHITSSDGSAVLPADHALASGVYTFTNGVTLRATGDQSITATDTATGLITGSQTAITVNPAAIASFTIAGYPSSTAAGTSFGGVVVTAYDTYGNVKTDYTGQVYFTSTDGAAVLPYTSGSRYTFVSGDQGDHIFAGFTLKTVGSRTITVTDGTRSATSAGITVVSGAIDHFTFAGVPASVTAGSGFAGSVTVTAYDSSNNVKTDYLGSVYFTSSDAQAVLAFNSGNMYTFVSGDNGVHAFAGSGFVLKTVPSQTITVRDDAASKLLTSSAVTVNFAALDHFTFNAINSPQPSGLSFSITITAKDLYENTVTSYTGQNGLTVSSGTVSPTNTAVFSSGAWTGQVTLSAVGSGITISTTGGSPLKSGTSNQFNVVRQVIFVSAGTGAGGTGGSITPSYPAGLQANDLILMQVTVRDTTTTPTTPAGFTLLDGPDSTGTGRQWIYYKFSTGSESGTITVTIGNSACKIARMYAFRNVALSSFTDDGSFGSGSSSTISSQPVTTTGVGELAVSFVFINNDNAVGSFTGESGGDWTEIAAGEFTSTAGSDGCVQLQTATMTSTGTISVGTMSGGGVPWGVTAFALKPA